MNKVGKDRSYYRCESVVAMYVEFQSAGHDLVTFESHTITSNTLLKPTVVRTIQSSLMAKRSGSGLRRSFASNEKFNLIL